jgi:hypothetical protein
VAQATTLDDALLSTLGALISQHLTKEAEAIIAGQALVLLQAVEDGLLSGVDADRFFTKIDFYLTNETEYEYSEEMADLLLECGVLHHYGEPPDELTAPRPALIRELATRILSAGA